MLWDFQNETPAMFLLDHWGFDEGLLPQLVPTFGEQGSVSKAAAEDFGLLEGTPVCYRAGDQPNNALSLNVLNPGEIAATAGTSGVVYGVTNEKKYDPKSRVNTFAHVNHTAADPRLGVLLCINGTGILNAWTRRLLGDISYVEMNGLAESAETLDAPSRVCNVTDEAQVRALVEAAISELGHVDVLINNAGLGGHARVVDMTDEQWSRVLDVTLTGTFRMTRAMLPHMLERGQGAIVNNA